MGVCVKAASRERGEDVEERLQCVLKFMEIICAEFAHAKKRR